MNYYRLLVLFVMLTLKYTADAQQVDSTIKLFHVKGGVTITTKGISLLPTFTLGKPAALFDLSLGRKKIFFEPQLRFALDGKPWSFIFWWRYKVVNTKRFKLGAGAHPAILFKTVSTTVNADTKSILQSDRYVACEIVPSYFLSKNISIGVYYLYSHGIDAGTIRNTNFLTVNANFSDIELNKGFYLQASPQFYYLSQDGKDGFYFTYTALFGKKGFPLTVQTIGNKTIKTHITSSKDFLWNLSLIYSFARTYAPHQ